MSCTGAHEATVEEHALATLSLGHNAASTTRLSRPASCCQNSKGGATDATYSKGLRLQLIKRQNSPEQLSPETRTISTMCSSSRKLSYVNQLRSSGIDHWSMPYSAILQAKRNRRPGVEHSAKLLMPDATLTGGVCQPYREVVAGHAPGKHFIRGHVQEGGVCCKEVGINGLERNTTDLKTSSAMTKV
eukprot:3867986-Amphidinium_carterae.1